MNETINDPIHVLHVDDDASLLNVTKLILKDMDNTIVIDSATCVDEAISMLKTKDYDIILSDYEMPQKNGLDFLRELRSKNVQTPYILFTGKGREEVAIRALNLGADRYLNKQGNPETVYTELIINMRQLHEKARAQNLLWESEERFEKIVTNTKDLIMLTQADGTILYLSPSCKDMLGYEPHELLGKYPSVIHAEDYEKIEKIFTTALTQESNGIIEYRVITKQGETRWVNHSFSQIVDNGEIKQIVGVVRDVTELKRAQLQLSENEERLRLLIENAPEAIYISDLKSNFIEGNKKTEELTGYKREELVGKSVFDLELVSKEAMPRLTRDLAEYSMGHKTGPSELVIKRKDGTSVIAEVSSFPVKQGEETVIMGIARDITERKNAELELQQKYEALERVTKSLDSGLAIIGKDYRVVWANSLLQSAAGIDRNKKCYQIFNNLNFVCPDCGVKKVFEENVSLDVHEYETKDMKGKPMWVELRVTPLKDKKGAVIAALELAVPITERKKVEARLAAVNEKLRVVGKLTRHDIRNKLSVINSEAYLIKKRHGNDPEVAKHLAGIETAVAMVNRLFDFSSLYEKIGVEEQTDIHVESCFSEAVALIPNLGNIKVINETSGLTVVADSLLRQVFYNLIDNSLKHGKKITQIRLHYRKQGEQVKLYYEDDGFGVPPENKLKIFSEGFTTSEGAGLGLPVIQKIMEVYNWSIQENGCPGKGVKFEITIPI